jgi:Na+/H+-dicarboxylate symporter
MIFLSVAWGIYGIGDVETLGTIGRTMMLSFLKYVFLATAGCVVFFPVLGNSFTSSSNQVSQIKAILEMILGIFPSTVVEPFSTGNTLQIIFLAVVIGIALLYMQRQTREIAIAIGQINALVNFLMSLISRLVPFVIFMVMVSLIWSGDLSVITSVWKFMGTFLIALLGIAAAYLLITSAYQKVSPSVLIRKSLPTFLVALTSASSAAAFGTNVETCEKRYGIDPSVVSFGVPLGIVVHKPTTAAYNLILVMYFASVYHVQCTPAWLLLAVFICVVVAVSAPPIPGGGAAAYTILFLQLGIPDEALAVALTLDIISDFLMTSFDMFTLQMALINISSKMNRIDKNTLRN